MRIASRQHQTHLRRRPKNRLRQGAAAVEMAVVATVLVPLAMGIIDVGQYIGVGQVVSNASREGARIAVRSDTEWSYEVETAVFDYMMDAMENVLPDMIYRGLEVSLTDQNGCTLSSDLTQVASGSEIQVHVSFDYQYARWAPNSFFGGSTVIESTTIMRRD